MKVPAARLPVALPKRTGQSFIIEGPSSPVAVLGVVAKALLRRAFYLLALSVVLFYAVHAMPGGAESAYRALDPALDADEIRRLMTLEGRDLPIWHRYLCWWQGRTASGCERWPGGGVLRGDLGYSRAFVRPVWPLLAERLTNTLRYMIPAVGLGLLGSVLFGLWAARTVGRWPDRLISAATFVGQSAPLHWTALLAIVGAAIYWPLFPPGGIAGVDDDSWLDLAHHAALPVACLAGYHAAVWTRYLRLELLSVEARPFVTAARAKGLPEHIVWYRHILPNAIVPLITSVSLVLPSVFSGALVIEKVFSYPGVGLLMIDSVQQQDHLTAMVVFLIYAALAMTATSLADGLVRQLDPRARSP